MPEYLYHRTLRTLSSYQVVREMLISALLFGPPPH